MNKINKQAVELEVIATRSLNHMNNAEQALAAGKYVLLEKPIAGNCPRERSVPRGQRRCLGSCPRQRSAEETESPVQLVVINRRSRIK